MDDCVDGDGKQKLLKSVLEEVIITVERQLSEMDIFKDSEADIDRLEYAPVTNLGCESEFAKLDNRLKVSGGSATVETLSRKNIVSTNKLLSDQSFTELTEEQKMGQWKWARKSKEVEEAKAMKKELIETVRLSKHLILKKKEMLKKNQLEKTHKALHICRQHGGPLTISTIDNVNLVNEKQLLSEIGYLWNTTHPNIRQQKQVRDANGKVKIKKLPEAELRINIRNYQTRVKG